MRLSTACRARATTCSTISAMVPTAWPTCWRCSTCWPSPSTACWTAWRPVAPGPRPARHAARFLPGRADPDQVRLFPALDRVAGDAARGTAAGPVPRAHPCMTARPPTSSHPAAPAPAGRSAALRHQLPGSPAKALPHPHSAGLARPATLRLALRKPVPKPIPPTSSATLRIAAALRNLKVPVSMVL